MAEREGGERLTEREGEIGEGERDRREGEGESSDLSLSLPLLSPQREEGREAERDR